jgi:cytochrome P450
MAAIADLLRTNVNVPVAALSFGAAAAALTYGVLKLAFQPVPSGPLLYRAQQKDTPVNPIARFFFGEFPTVVLRPAGWIHRQFTRIARETLGDKRAHAYFFTGPSIRLLVTNTGDVDYILHQHPTRYTKGEIMKFLETLLGPHGLVTIRDEDYHTQQFKNVGPAFNTANIRDMAATTMREHFAALVQRLRAEAKADKMVLHGYWNETTLAIISEAAFNSKDFASMRHSLDTAVLTFSPLMAIGPRLYNLLPTARGRAMHRIRKDVLKRVQSVVQRFRANKRRYAASVSESEDDIAGKKLIDLLAMNPDLSEPEILDHTLTFVFAGHETTANALNWLTYLLAVNSRVQTLLLEELKGSVQLNTTPTVSTVLGLPYLRAVCDEALRIIPPVAAIARESNEDDILPESGTFVPKGTPIIIPTNVLHRDTDVYGPDADDFRPDRWIEDPQLKARATPYNFMPFGAGKRACIGKDFAMHEMLIGAALFFRNFEVSWPEGEPEPFPRMGIVVRPRSPFHVFLKPRVV